MAPGARQLWLARLPTDGLAWWVVVGRQAGEQPGLLLGPANYPIPSQQIAQPLFWTANLSSAGASVLPQAQPEMHLIFPRRCQSKAPLSDHTPGFAHECVAKPPCNYVKCQATLFGGRLITSTTKPTCSAPSLFCWQSSPGPPARASNAITPTRAHSFHTALPGLGLCQPPVVAAFLLIVRWLPAACLSLTKPVGPPLAAHRLKPRPWTCSEGQH